MTVPTIEKFNSWNEKDKAWWLNFETDGFYKKMKQHEGYFPVIFYEKEDVGIVYSVDQKGNLIEATAMTINEALDRLSRFKNAADEVMSAAKYS